MDKLLIFWACTIFLYIIRARQQDVSHAYIIQTRYTDMSHEQITVLFCTIITYELKFKIIYHDLDTHIPWNLHNTMNFPKNISINAHESEWMVHTCFIWIHIKIATIIESESKSSFGTHINIVNIQKMLWNHATITYIQSLTTKRSNDSLLVSTILDTPWN